VDSADQFAFSNEFDSKTRPDPISNLLNSHSSGKIGLAVATYGQPVLGSKLFSATHAKKMNAQSQHFSA
jgi:hypothetical protein